MFENTNNEEVIPAKLVDDEALIQIDNIDYVEDITNDFKDKYEAATAASTNLIGSPEPKEEVPGLGYLAGGALGSTVVTKSPGKKVLSKKTEKKDTIAVHSTRNVTWSGVGKVYTGYNIVSKEASLKWLERDHIRLATPEEVAKEFGL
jgi:hypothetical protein